jgi:citronellol/citronellal dehydrogenase
MERRSRSPKIMADAAYVIFNRDSRVFTGQFVLDDSVLHEEGIVDFSQYQYSEDLEIDIFVDASWSV